MTIQNSKFTPLEIYPALKRRIRHTPQISSASQGLSCSASLTGLTNSKTIAKRYQNFAFCILHFDFQNFSSRKKNSGFTLVEMVISMGLFAILVTAVVGIMISVSRAQVKAAQVQAVHDNIRFSMELMTREMRTGGNYKLTTACTAFGLGTEVEFTNFNPNPAEYRRYYVADSDSDGTPDMLMRITAPDANFDGVPDTVVTCGQALPFTSDEVFVDRFLVTLRGQALGANDGQPMATILLRVRSRSPRIELETSMDLQITVEQRFRDL